MTEIIDNIIKVCSVVVKIVEAKNVAEMLVCYEISHKILEFDEL